MPSCCTPSPVESRPRTNTKLAVVASLRRRRISNSQARRAPAPAPAPRTDHQFTKVWNFARQRGRRCPHSSFNRRRAWRFASDGAPAKRRAETTTTPTSTLPDLGTSSTSQTVCDSLHVTLPPPASGRLPPSLLCSFCSGTDVLHPARPNLARPRFTLTVAEQLDVQ